jgi:hypothetical protein
MNDCTENKCTLGVPSNPFLAEGTACNGGAGVCNGDSMNPLCVECTPNFMDNCVVNEVCNPMTLMCEM